MIGPKILLSDEEMPTQWYNIAVDVGRPVPPPLHPGTGQPLTPADLAALFPMALIEQEMSSQRFIPIPEPVLDALARSGQAYVIATLRSDFYPAFSKRERLMSLKEGAGHYDLLPADAAAGEVQVHGHDVDVDRRDVAVGLPGNLPQRQPLGHARGRRPERSVRSRDSKRSVCGSYNGSC